MVPSSSDEKPCSPSTSCLNSARALRPIDSLRSHSADRVSSPRGSHRIVQAPTEVTAVSCPSADENAIRASIGSSVS
jgi:hypothetical protein